MRCSEHPDQIRLFETYASPERPLGYIHSPHLLKSKAVTANMNKSLTLL